MPPNEIVQAQPQQIAQSAPMSMTEILHHVSLVKNVMKTVMIDGTHYGIVPGTPKPSLWKPGAEVLLLAFRLAPRYEVTEARDGEHYTATVRCILSSQSSGMVIAEGLGSCSTREKKYAYRKQGDKWIPNEYLADQYNTVLKIACKRALVAGVLNATAASDVFSQDLEDLDDALRVAENRPPVARPQPKAPAAAPGATSQPSGQAPAAQEAPKPVQEPPRPSQEAAQGAAPASQPCSEAQRKLIFARWKASGIPKEQFDALLKQGGYNDIASVGKGDVDYVLSWIESNKVSG